MLRKWLKSISKTRVSSRSLSLLSWLKDGCRDNQRSRFTGVRSHTPAVCCILWRTKLILLINKFKNYLWTTFKSIWGHQYIAQVIFALSCDASRSQNSKLRVHNELYIEICGTTRVHDRKLRANGSCVTSRLEAATTSFFTETLKRWTVSEAKGDYNGRHWEFKSNHMRALFRFL